MTAASTSAVLTAGERIREREGVAPVDVDVAGAQRPESGHVRRLHREARGAEVIEGLAHVAGVPEHDGVEHQAERPELVLLPLTVALPELPTLAMEEHPCQGMAALA